jgi:hypothetical protein
LGTFSSVWTVIGTSGWSGRGRPAIVYGAVQLNVFVRGIEGYVWQTRCLSSCDSPASWDRFYDLGGLLASDPAVAAPRDVLRVDVLATNVDGAAFTPPTTAKGLWLKTWVNRVVR